MDDLLPAVRDRRQRAARHDLRLARVDTAIGAVFTQVIMIAVLVTCAATLFVHHVNVTDAAHAALALVPLAGSKPGGSAFGACLRRAALLGALVGALASAWGFSGAFAWRCSQNAACDD